MHILLFNSNRVKLYRIILLIGVRGSGDKYDNFQRTDSKPVLQSYFENKERISYTAHKR